MKYKLKYVYFSCRMKFMSKEKTIDFGKFGKIELINLDSVFNESVLLAAACFHPSTKVVLHNGKSIEIGKLKVGDRLLRGGKVYMCLNSVSNDLYLVGGTVVSGNHAIYDKTNRNWVYVKDFSKAKKLPGTSYVTSVACEKHLICTEDDVIFSDYYMTDKFADLLNDELLTIINEELVPNSIYPLSTAELKKS